ncbi:Vacuolar ATPase assembly integral membrane protein vma21 [Schizosaccharomyces pombe]|uniref:Vacuolar ATPase assembly integral membrane protein vma21 n=1 Tax=Schizosaccharomyces pombe (strain 972 / ATCC 24843) TaxID=284812 RepID=VMA21_SCHPO|nr:putative vacuolar H+-ATPase assembly protein Vma21 [Schizosaccharomyces pombe]C6Y4C8.1 RecName: Full=Vacuolar ATPase assembly integral membrane protein vma21 [Schizosaccharomyces pombe 972h-]CBA11515.1 vacuolar H+-ATPase assembly protein Vma21 (predicted) [Schizosaccharomyces pombe]|eukprot:NP_001343090.1 putative vacuolar H+-ATPase assembly protein Vma21 [Schizosaccharomyces pombe]
MERKSQVSDTNNNSIPTNVLLKFVGFSVALFTLPLITYFWTLKTLFKGYQTLYAGLSAAVMVNIILALYIVAAFREDSGTPKKDIKRE